MFLRRNHSSRGRPISQCRGITIFAPFVLLNRCVNNVRYTDYHSLFFLIQLFPPASIMRTAASAAAACVASSSNSSGVGRYAVDELITTRADDSSLFGLLTLAQRLSRTGIALRLEPLLVLAWRGVQRGAGQVLVAALELLNELSSYAVCARGALRCIKAVLRRDLPVTQLGLCLAAASGVAMHDCAGVLQLLQGVFGSATRTDLMVELFKHEDPLIRTHAAALAGMRFLVLERTPHRVFRVQVRS